LGRERRHSRKRIVVKSGLFYFAEESGALRRRAYSPGRRFLTCNSFNRFLSSVVRIQTDRGQHVITAGPYAWARHPGYLASIVIMVASGPALGSWIAAAFLVVASLPFLLHRAVTEDRVLIAELPGYRRYARRVRWRLLPG
jgi:protein-S-isoprenylcysteine O-methyltransferase Ste14